MCLDLNIQRTITKEFIPSVSELGKAGYFWPPAGNDAALPHATSLLPPDPLTRVWGGGNGGAVEG